MGDDGLYIERFMYDEIRVVRPSLMDVRHVSRCWKSGDLSRYFMTLRDLMLAGFCLLLCCSPAMAEDIFKPTGRYLQVTTGDSEPVTLERTGNPRRFSFSSKMPAETTTKPAAVVKDSLTTQSSIYNGKAGSSHKNRASLINHLLTEGVHSGRHTSQQLNAMTDSELNALHNSDHGSKPSQQPAIRMQQSACPGGRCPVPTNRRRLFR